MMRRFPQGELLNSVVLVVRASSPSVYASRAVNFYHYEREYRINFMPYAYRDDVDVAVCAATRRDCRYLYIRTW